MWRYLVGMAAGVLLVVGGLLVWQNTAVATHVAPLLPQRLAATVAQGDDAVPDPPQASEKTREQKRFSRYDHDKDGKVSRDEFLAARRRAFAKLDLNGDGRLSFDEYAVKGEKRFADADGNHDASLDAAEFATTRLVRKAKPNPRCPPVAPAHGDEEGTADSDRG